MESLKDNNEKYLVQVAFNHHMHYEWSFFLRKWCNTWFITKTTAVYIHVYVSLECIPTTFQIKIYPQKYFHKIFDNKVLNTNAKPIYNFTKAVTLSFNEN